MPGEGESRSPESVVLSRAIEPDEIYPIPPEEGIVWLYKIELFLR